MPSDTDLIDDSACRLYLITPAQLPDISAFHDQLQTALITGGTHIGAVQLRLKDTPDAQIRQAAKTLLPLCQKHQVAFFLNDHANIAADIGADGVHLGQEDMPIQQARTLLGTEAVIGITCHDSPDLAMQAGANGADYIAFGAFYPSQTKQGKGHPTPDILTWWSQWAILPSVAIGGITPENAPPLVEAGADFLAVISAVWNHPQGVEAAIRAFLPALSSASRG